MKLAKKFRSPVEPRSFGSGLIVGCFLVSMTYFMVSKDEIVNCLPSSPSSSSLSGASPMSSAVGNNRKIPFSGDEKATHESRPTRIEVLEVHDNSSSENFSSTDIIPDGAAEKKPTCDFSGYRTVICDMEGDIRIIGKNLSSVLLVAPPDTSSRDRDRNESLQIIKPYPRKNDRAAMAKVRTVNLKSLHGDQEEAPRCDINHTVPGIVFSTGGHCGNCFHDFSDVLIPLFQTASPFRGQVQFVITNRQGWWMHKYGPYLSKLSSYDVIDFDNDDRVHCFKHLTVGLRTEKDLMIDPSESPNYSIMDFVKLTRSVYSLERDRSWKAIDEKKPRLLFIARGSTRKFMNLDQLVATAEEVGFEAVVAEPDFFDVARFARTVNSCDVMVGVHGAGLTNFVFLPTDGIVVQVLPLGKLDWLAQHFYAEPAMGMKLRHLQYNITVEESTLSELYPRDHQVFKDPESFHEGWFKLQDIYLKQQNVRIDVNRFRTVLEKAIELLHEKTE